jgi:ABC-2 type transport system permease protein
MTHLSTLTRVRIQLALRNKMFFFFSVVMPLGIFFLYAGIFAKGNPDAVRFFLGPVLALNVMGSFWGLSATLVTFREQGILRSFHVTPVTAVDMLASSVLANFVLTIPTFVSQLIFARYLFHVEHLGNLLSMFILVGIGTISFGSLGLVVASITNTMQETQVLNQIIWLPMLFLSGATFPLAFLPKVVQSFSVFLPATYLVTALQLACFRSTSITELMLPFGLLAFWSVLTFFVSAQLFRWEPEAKIPRNAKVLALATIIPFLVLGVVENHTGFLKSQAQSAYQALDKMEQAHPQAQQPK